MNLPFPAQACWRRLARAASSDAERAALKRAAAAETARALEELADRGDAAAGRRVADAFVARFPPCPLYTSPSPRD